jgi:hypothetical protein
VPAQRLGEHRRAAGAFLIFLPLALNAFFFLLVRRFEGFVALTNEASLRQDPAACS